jgi:hypothetical protein
MLFVFHYNEVLTITYCLDEETAKKLAETAAKTVTENTNTVNFSDPNNLDVHIHNPNFQIINNLGKAMSNLGAGGGARLLQVFMHYLNQKILLEHLLE